MKPLARRHSGGRLHQPGRQGHLPLGLEAAPGHCRQAPRSDKTGSMPACLLTPNITASALPDGRICHCQQPASCQCVCCDLCLGQPLPGRMHLCPEAASGRAPQSWCLNGHSVAAAGPGIIILLAGLILPESPSSLAENGHIERARHVRPSSQESSPGTCMMLAVSPDQCQETCLSSA